jgi:hypothetical protein
VVDGACGLSFMPNVARPYTVRQPPPRRNSHIVGENPHINPTYTDLRYKKATALRFGALIRPAVGTPFGDQPFYVRAGSNQVVNKAVYGEINADFTENLRATGKTLEQLQKNRRHHFTLRLSRSRCSQEHSWELNNAQMVL